MATSPTTTPMADDKKVISLDRARRDKGRRLPSVEKPFEFGAWHTRVLTNGDVELRVDIGHSIITQAMNEKQFRLFVDGLLRTHSHQRRHLSLLHSSHLWVARAHPNSPSHLLVRHDNHEVSFRKATAGRRQAGRGLPAPYVIVMTPHVVRVPCTEVAAHGEKATRHWHCDGCGGCLVAGAEMWVEEKGKLGQERRWPDAKLCAKCVQPREGGVREVARGE